MKTSFRMVVGMALSGSLLAAPIATTLAASYPDRPIQLVVGFPPGGSADTAARIFTPLLSEKLGQTVVLDNRAGAGGVIGVDHVAKSAPDGYTMGIGVSGALTSNVTLMPNLPYDPRTDLTPVTMLVDNPLVFVVSRDLGPKDLTEFVEYVKQNPGKVSYGTAGPGTAMNLAGELINQRAGIDMEHVAYKGSNPALVDVMASHIEGALIDLATVRPHLESGRVVALAVTSPERTPLAEDIPTVAEQGFDDFSVQAWFGLVMPAGVPSAIVDQVNTAVGEVLADQRVSEQLMAAGLVPATGTSAEFAERISREIDIYADLIKSANITR